MAVAATQNIGNTGIGIGAGVLGLAFLGAGVWWWRRREDEAAEEIGGDTVEGLLAEIQSLEEAFERGELPEEEYQEKRVGLRDRLKETASLIHLESSYE